MLDQWPRFSCGFFSFFSSSAKCLTPVMRCLPKIYLLWALLFRELTRQKYMMLVRRRDLSNYNDIGPERLLIQHGLIYKVSLEEYRNKRDFSRTPEPKQNSSKTKQKKNKGPQVNNYYSQRFVVQKHHARRLHYDFRLETNDGLLKSWAIPWHLT